MRGVPAPTRSVGLAGTPILSAVLTPVAFAAPPLLEVGGVHEPYVLRSVLELRCADGVVGLGESYGDEAFLDEVRTVLPEIVGLDVYDLNRISAMTKERFRTARTQSAVFSLIEVAALDAQGRYAGRPVVDLLGGPARDRIDFAASLFHKFDTHLDGATDRWGELRTPDDLVAAAHMMVDEYGFRSLKLNGGVYPPEEELESVHALADAFPGHPVRLAPNGAWTPRTGILMAAELSGAVEYLEDPTPGVAAMARVAGATTLPLATKASVVTCGDVAPAFRQGAVDVVLPDHHAWSGLRAATTVAGICRAFGIEMSMRSGPHLGISLAAMVHAAAAAPRLGHACDTYWPWRTGDVIVPGALAMRGGAVTVPSGPGLGVELDRDALARGHEQYLRSGLTRHDERGYMRRFDANFEPNTERW